MINSENAQNSNVRQMIDSTFLDGDFRHSIKNYASQYSSRQRKVDNTKWLLAKDVNEWWPEHAGIFSGDKKSYYAEVSRIANEGLSVRILGESGQTLRRWCEVAATYENMPEAESFLEALSFDHLQTARKLARDGKIDAPDHALAVAVNEGLSADDMRERFDPYHEPHPYDVISGHLAYMTERSHWEFIKSADVRDEVMSHISAIDMTVRMYLESEEKAI